MVRITITYYGRHHPNPTVTVEVPAVPSEGEYLSHEPSGISGYVKGVQWWWPENGGDLVIEVQVK